MKKYSLILLSIITFTSCSTYKHSYRLTNVPDNSVKVTATVVDVKTNFDKKVTGESDKKTPSVADAKANAYYNAIRQNDIDVLVDPIYSVRVKRGLFNSTATASVTGFAGEFVNPRSLSDTHQEAYDAKIKSLQQFLNLTAIVNEDKPTTIINNCCGGCEGDGSVSSQTFNGAPALLDQFNNLYGVPEVSTSDDANSDGGDASGLGSITKKSGLLKLLPFVN